MEAVSILSALKGEKLKDAPQWPTWFARVQLYAIQKNVWDHCNPDTPSTERLDTLKEPVEPEYPEEGDKRDRRIWQDLMDVYKMKYTRWEKQAKGLSDVNEYILTYLDPMHHLSLITYRTPYDILVYLKSRFARSTAYEEEIRMKGKVFAMQKPKIEAIQINRHMPSVAKAAFLSLYDRWILDTGSSVHMCNNKDLFVEFTPYITDLTMGDSTTPVLGKGKVRLVGRHPVKGRMEITLSDALYSPSFHTNLVSYAMLRKKGGIWCQRTNCIRDPNDRPVVCVNLWDQFNLWIFDKPGEDLPP